MNHLSAEKNAYIWRKMIHWNDDASQDQGLKNFYFLGKIFYSADLPGRNLKIFLKKFTKKFQIVKFSERQKRNEFKGFCNIDRELPKTQRIQRFSALCSVWWDRPKTTGK